MIKVTVETHDRKLVRIFKTDEEAEDFISRHKAQTVTKERVG